MGRPGRIDLNIIFRSILLLSNTFSVISLHQTILTNNNNICLDKSSQMHRYML